MTSMTVVEGWGEARERARMRQRRRTRVTLIAVAAAVGLATPLLYGVVATIPGMGDRAPAVTTALSAVLIAMVAVAAGLYAWRRHDEVQRRRATNSWAAAGIAGFVAFPVLRQIAPLLGWEEPGHAVWLAMLVIAIAAQLGQRWRG